MKDAYLTKYPDYTEGTGYCPRLEQTSSVAEASYDENSTISIDIASVNDCCTDSGQHEPMENGSTHGLYERHDH